MHETPVLVVGGGPAGLITALQLSANNVRCMLAERNPDTTKWPKMDITNCRSMELFRRLGIADSVRQIGVPQHFSFDVNFSTGLSEPGELLTKWELPSPDWWRHRIRQLNDGTMPREPYQRCSQAVLEAWLKPRIQADRNIESHFGLRFERLTETEDYVESELLDQDGQLHIVKSQMVIGCDGAHSKVRSQLQIALRGESNDFCQNLMHFTSRDFTRLHSQGQFWHIFFTTGAVIISQDEVCTWTVHIPVPPGTEASDFDPEQAIYKALGTTETAFPIKIDKILLNNVWRGGTYLADKYTSPDRRVFLSGDSAHQNIPTGGYGMNTAVGDSFDIGWKVAAVLNGYGGPRLLQSYEEERRPVAARNVARARTHSLVHRDVCKMAAAVGKDIYTETPAGRETRERIKNYMREHCGENRDHGIEMGYRYKSCVIAGEDDGQRAQEPPWIESKYIPSTWPGARAPHVFLKDGETSIYDCFGTGAQFSLIDFTPDARYTEAFQAAARNLGVPLKSVHLPNEDHVRSVWERDTVLIRPDDHVAWRAPLSANITQDGAKDVLRTVLGWV